MMLGETNPADSKPGSIRGDLCINIGRNIIHGSDTLENAKREVGLWFKDEEFVTYTPCAQPFPVRVNQPPPLTTLNPPPPHYPPPPPPSRPTPPAAHPLTSSINV
ncbi:nucleoside diphosphate kinase B-like [Menidia menidia]